MAEELTENERSLLESLYIPGADAPGRKALRLLDAHAALRAEVDMQRRRADHHQGAAEALRADYQAALDTEHRLACEWRARYEAECVEHAVTRDRLTAEAAELRAKAKTPAEQRVLDAVKAHYERSPGKLPEDVWRAYAELARREGTID